MTPSEFANYVKVSASSAASQIVETAKEFPAIAAGSASAVSEFVSNYSDVPALFVFENLKTPLKVVNASVSTLKGLYDNFDVIVDTYRMTGLDLASYHASYVQHITDFVYGVNSQSIDSPSPALAGVGLYAPAGGQIYQVERSGVSPIVPVSEQGGALLSGLRVPSLAAPAAGGRASVVPRYAPIPPDSGKQDLLAGGVFASALSGSDLSLFWLSNYEIESVVGNGFFPNGFGWSWLLDDLSSPSFFYPGVGMPAGAWHLTEIESGLASWEVPFDNLLYNNLYMIAAARQREYSGLSAPSYYLESDLTYSWGWRPFATVGAFGGESTDLSSHASGFINYYHCRFTRARYRRFADCRVDIIPLIAARSPGLLGGLCGLFYGSSSFVNGFSGCVRV